MESEAISSATSHPHLNEVESNSTNHAAIPKPITSVAEELKEWGKSLGIPPSGLPEMPRNEGIEPDEVYQDAVKTELALDQVIASLQRLTSSQVNRLVDGLASLSAKVLIQHLKLEKLSSTELSTLITDAQAAHSRLINQEFITD